MCCKQLPLTAVRRSGAAAQVAAAVGWLSRGSWAGVRGPCPHRSRFGSETRSKVYPAINCVETAGSGVQGVSVCSGGAGEVVESGDAEHCGGDALAAQDFPGVHPCERVLDSGADLPVGGVVRFLPSHEVFPWGGGVG